MCDERDPPPRRTSRPQNENKPPAFARRAVQISFGLILRQLAEWAWNHFLGDDNWWNG